jgi:di/tricarboxylate transporter
VDEKKTMFWLALAVGLWATDILHHIRPEVVAIGIGLALTLPKLGVLGTRAIREVNYLLIVFLGGVLSMGEVLLHTKALDVLGGNTIMAGMTSLLRNSFVGTIVLYWAGFAYHFLLASEFSMLSTSLPVVIRFAQTHGYNPVALAMVWSFAAGGKLFVYQSSVLMLGYSYGYFQTRDLLRVGFFLTVIQGVLLVMLVPFYWPLIGLHWMQ